jgi:hypothetical protein
LPAHLGIVCKSVLVVGALLVGSWLLPATVLAEEIPQGMVAFFPGTECPPGWSVSDEPRGRLILGTTSAGAVGRTYGFPALGDREDRQHTHYYIGYPRLTSKSICGVCGGANQLGARAGGTRRVEGDTEPATTGLPFIQYLVCEKN